MIWIVVVASVRLPPWPNHLDLPPTLCCLFSTFHICAGSASHNVQQAVLFSLKLIHLLQQEASWPSSTESRDRTISAHNYFFQRAPTDKYESYLETLVFRDAVTIKFVRFNFFLTTYNHSTYCNIVRQVKHSQVPRLTWIPKWVKESDKVIQCSYVWFESYLLYKVFRWNFFWLHG